MDAESLPRYHDGHPTMRAVIQRVSEASVAIGGQIISRIGHGLLVLLGVEETDDASDVEWLAGKITRMRIFGDAEGKMNLSVVETGGGVLVVSQFTLHASTKKGNRPSFIRAGAPAHSEPLYEAFCAAMERETGRSVMRGVFGGDMRVSLINDGPVTIVIDSRARE
jgi:D-tyrosyl-tRNA(Tyr) deacylase